VFNTGVYTLDTANSVLVKIPNLNLGGGQYDGFNATVGADGALWIPTQSGPLLRVEVLGQGSVSVETVLPGGKSGDGFVSTRQGYVTAIYAGDPEFLYVAYGGRTGGRTASVFAIRYKQNALGFYPWHSIYSDSTTNRYVYHIFGTPGPDNTPRIHIVTEASGASVMQSIAEYIYSPLAGVTQSRQTAYVEFAEDDLGDPHTNSGIFQARLDAEDLSASNETVVLKDSIVQGEAWTTNTRGTFTDTVANLSYSGGLGISAKIYKPRLELNVDGTDTNWPKVHELEIAARVRLQTLYYWDLEIDVAATANMRRNSESIIASELNSVIAGAVLVPFQIGKDAVRNVEVTALGFETEVAGPDGFGGLGSRTGVARLRVEEVI
jgi:hypothetical protein